VDAQETERRAGLIVEQCAGIHPPHEALYIRSIAYSAGRSVEAFRRFDAANSDDCPAELQVSLVHEALGHAAALSRYFWPSGLGGRRSPTLRNLAKARASKLREAFEVDEESPLKSRRLRDALEHFDERLDAHLMSLDAGMIFPDPMVGSVEASAPPIHLFKMVDPSTSQFVLLGELYAFGSVRKEVQRVLALAEGMDRVGCRLGQQWIE